MKEKYIHGFPVPQIGVGGIVFNDRGAVLMIKRNQKPALGQWSVPGGKLAPGETLQDACRREVNEETGLEIRIGHVVAVVERRIENFHYIIIDFMATLTPEGLKVPRACSDVDEARWIQVKKLEKYDLVEGLEKIIRKAHQSCQEGKSFRLVDPAGRRTDFY